LYDIAPDGRHRTCAGLEATRRDALVDAPERHEQRAPVAPPKERVPSRGERCFSKRRALARRWKDRREHRRVRSFGGGLDYIVYSVTRSRDKGARPEQNAGVFHPDGEAPEVHSVRLKSEGEIQPIVDKETRPKSPRFAVERGAEPK